MVHLKISHKKKLGADAKIIRALLNDQPLSRSDISTITGIRVSTVYRNIPILINESIVKEVTENKLALSTYTDIEMALEYAIQKRVRESDHVANDVVYISEVANEVGEAPDKIRDLSYKIGNKYNVAVYETK